ncbi:hypothetical protein [Bradyrhizobium sp. Leo170]|uniref:hypothetical protein n=1 Tax=Bradyrhizobium sp. Leo170 TaxID=1571199 RepID=UPI00102E398C|nr:hypothetical protein [Bradyrhizobium sp. Leo170]
MTDKPDEGGRQGSAPLPRDAPEDVEQGFAVHIRRWNPAPARAMAGLEKTGKPGDYTKAKK